MKKESFEEFTLFNYMPAADDFREEVLAGLSKEPKRLPCKFFYDERGMELFDQICEVEEYYPTRTEIGILEQNISEITSVVGENCLLVEFGCGSGIKTQMLLRNLNAPAAYIPIDIEKSSLVSFSKQLKEEHPDLEVLPVCADFNSPIILPPASRHVEKTVTFFPGSTIGNFEPEEATNFMRNVASLCGKDGSLLLGVDLKKDVRTLEAAYNDEEGVTAAFNLNLMSRIQKEFDADLSLESFAHDAVFDEEHSRIEMHIVSLEEQLAKLDGKVVPFKKGERIVTEYSYKYDLDDFGALADRAGFKVSSVWTDEDDMFSVQYLIVNSAEEEPLESTKQRFTIGDESLQPDEDQNCS